MSRRTLALMRLRPALLALAALLALVGSSLPASASQSLVSASGTGQVWTAAKVVTDGSPVTSTVRLTEVALPLQAGFRVYDTTRKLVHSGTISYLDGDEGVQVQAAPATGVDVRYSTLERGSSVIPTLDVALGLNTQQAGVLRGEYTILVWVGSSGIGRWQWDVTGGAGTASRGATLGDSVLLATSRDFVGQAGAVVAARGAAARAQVLTTRSFDVRNTLVGSFAPVLTSVDALRVQRGAGAEQACVPACTFSGAPGEPGAAPGRHLFSISGAGAGGVVQNTGEVLLGVADVRLPK